MTRGKDNIVRILFLGGAKRVAMARLFAKTLEEKGYGCEIYGYELDTRCPLASVGTVFKGLRWRDPKIFDDLTSICTSRNIDIVLPFVDPAVSIASELVFKYCPEVFSPVSEADAADKMFDKVAAADLFEQLGLPVPTTYRGGAFTSKLIAKPRFGSASKGIIKIDCTSDLEAIDDTDAYLIQERIDNRREYTIDCYVSRQGRILAVSPRVREEVSGGEVVRTTTIDSAEAVSLVRKVLEATGLRGAVTVQLIHDLDSDRLLVMEINPRLGGGCVASVYAGADIPALIVEEALGLNTAERLPRAGVVTTRYLADVVFYSEN